MLFLSASSDRGKVVESHGIFLVAEKLRLPSAMSCWKFVMYFLRNDCTFDTQGGTGEAWRRDDWGFYLEEDSDFKGDGIYGYIAKANIALSLTATSSEGVLDADWDSDLDGNTVTLVLQSSRSHYSTWFAVETVEHWQLVVVLLVQNYRLYICLICSTIGTSISTV